MIERLAEWVAAWPEERVATLLLQDMALCKAWCYSVRSAPLKREARESVEARIEFWQRGGSAPDLDTGGRRHQRLLREVIALLHEDRHHEIDGDRAAFLWAAHELAVDVGHARIESFIAPHIEVLQDIHRKTPPSHALSQLSKHILYCTEAELLRAPQRETRLLAGIELPCRGPVLTAPKHLRLLGDVPDDCTVVVEGEGHCCVDGYVLGRVLAKTQCEVRGNISGAVVVLNEDIRARSIINNAWVVAKLGSVHARTAQGPKLVFAGNRIAIAGSTMLGHYIARDMEVRDDVRGGRVEVANQLTAQHFQHLGQNTLKLVLRDHLSSEDYGELTGSELKHLLSQANRLKRKVRNFEAIAELAQREAEHAAQTVLMYLFGGMDNQKKLEQLVSMRNRLDLLNRLIRNLSAALADAELMLIGLDVDAHDKEGEADFLAIDMDTPLDKDLAREREDVIQLQHSLSTRKMDRRKTARLVKRVTDKIRRLQDEHDKIAEVIALREREFQVQGGHEELLAGAIRGESKLQVLQKVLPTLRKQPPNGSIAARLMSGFVTLALRNIERRMGHIQEYRIRADACRTDFGAVAEQLGKEFHVTLPEVSDAVQRPARVVGRFEDDVKIYLGVYVESADELPEGRILATVAKDTQQSFMLPAKDVGFHTNRIG